MTSPSGVNTETQKSACIRALVVDDEVLGRKNLCLALEAHSHWQVVAQASSVAGAQDALQSHAVDVIFLDIQMPRQSGLVLARTLCHQDTPPWIVFVTAFNEHAVDAFELHALDYVLKPFSDRRLAQTLERVEHMVHQRQHAAYGRAMRDYVAEQGQQNKPSKTYWQHLSVRSVGRIETVALSEVLRIEAQGNYAELHLASRRVLFRAAMSKLEEHLDPTVFLRIHRGTIVRRDQLTEMLALPGGGYALRLRNGDRVGVGERYCATAKAAMGAHQ